MSSTSVIADATWQQPGAPAIDVAPRRSPGPMLIGPSAAVVALRRAAVITVGGFTEPATSPAGRLVAAYDATGTAWWIDAGAVWSDAATSVHPERLRPVGLATGASSEHAMVLGISDRLGRDVVCELDHGAELPQLDVPGGWESATVYDGRGITGVPTVAVVGGNFVRWGAGATWEFALQRAVYGKTPAEAAKAELADLQRSLDDDGRLIVGVEVGSELLIRAGISRLSVQLVTAHDGLGR